MKGLITLIILLLLCSTITHLNQPLFTLLLFEAIMVSLLGTCLIHSMTTDSASPNTLLILLLILGAGEGVVGIGMIMHQSQRQLGNRRN